MPSLKCHNIILFPATQIFKPASKFISTQRLLRIQEKRLHLVPLEILPGDCDRTMNEYCVDRASVHVSAKLTLSLEITAY